MESLRQQAANIPNRIKQRFNKCSENSLGIKRDCTRSSVSYTEKLFILLFPFKHSNLNILILFKKKQFSWMGSNTTEFGMYQNSEAESWDHVQKPSCLSHLWLQPAWKWGWITRTLPAASPWSRVSTEHPEGPMHIPGRAVTSCEASVTPLDSGYSAGTQGKPFISGPPWRKWL